MRKQLIEGRGGLHSVSSEHFEQLDGSISFQVCDMAFSSWSFECCGQSKLMTQIV